MSAADIFKKNKELAVGGRALFGRRKITASFPQSSISQEKFKNIFEQAMAVHLKNMDEIQYLYDYARGNQPILYRSNKDIRPEINTKTVENWAKTILKFKLGFIFSEPMQLIKNSNKKKKLMKTSQEPVSEEKLDTQVMLLNDYFQEVEKHNADKKCGFWMIVCGVGYECILPSKELQPEVPFKVYSLDPRTTFVIYSSEITAEPLMAVTFTVREDEVDNTKYFYDIVAYTNFSTITATLNSDFVPVSYVESVNILKVIPIVEFNYDELRQGGFEPVIPLLDNLNLICSDRMNDIQQAVQWFIKFINVDIDEEKYEKFKAKGAIVVKSEPGNPAQIDVVSTSLNQTQIQTFKEDMLRCVHLIANVPERNSNPGNNTGQALIVGQGWADAEGDAKEVEVGIKSGQKQLLRIALAICETNSNVPDEVKATRVETIDIKLTRNRSDNMLVKTQSLKTMLDSGVAPILAFKLCGLFDDPQKAYELSKDSLEAYFLSNKRNIDIKDTENHGKGVINPEDGIYNQSQELTKKLNKN